MRLSTLDLRISCDFLFGRFFQSKKTVQGFSLDGVARTHSSLHGEIMKCLLVFLQTRNRLVLL